MIGKTDDFKSARRWSAINRLAQIVLGISLVCALNYLASQSSVHRRWDITSGGGQTLSLETASTLDTLALRASRETTRGEPWVRIYPALLPEDWRDADHPELYKSAEMVHRHVSNLLADIKYAVAKNRPDNWLKIEADSPLSRAELKSRFPVDAQTVLVVTCKDRHKLISMSDLYTAAAGLSFRGEEVLLSALLNVTRDRQQVVYHTVGHFERSPAPAPGAPDGMVAFAQKLRTRNILLKELDLDKENDVPTDAGLVLIASPRVRFMPAEVEKLRRFMDRDGRLLAFLSPESNARLDSLFQDWGIFVDNALVVDKSEAAKSSDGGLRVSFNPTLNHSLTALLGGAGRLDLGRARPVREDTLRLHDETIRVSELAGTNPDPALAWGARNYLSPHPRFNPDIDLPPPVSVVAVAERAAGMGMKLRVTRSGRMVVVGSGIALDDRHINGNNDNATFFLGCVNWMLDRDQYLNIPPRPASNFHLRAETADLTALAWRFSALPLLILIFGLAVSLWRRHT